MQSFNINETKIDLRSLLTQSQPVPYNGSAIDIKEWKIT